MVTKALFVDAPVLYDEAASVQERLVSMRVADEIGDIVLFLEHPKVITVGRGGDISHLLVSPEDLAEAGVELVRSSRGGNITCHAPGQLIMYPILKLTGSETDVHDYVSRLEEVAIRSAASFGVTAFRRDGMPGAWTADGKLAAVGVRLRHWVTSHGLSMNVDVARSVFELIVPCGLEGEHVVTLSDLLRSACPDIGDVRERMAEQFSVIFNRQLTTARIRDLSEL